MSNRLKSRLKVLSIEELKQLARNEGLDEYSYPELLADFLIENIEYEYLEEDVSRIEDSKAEMKRYLTKRKISFLRDMASERGILGYKSMNKTDLINTLIFTSFSGFQCYNTHLSPKNNKIQTYKKKKSKSPRKRKKIKKKDKIELEDYTVDELKKMLKNRGLSGYSKMKKQELIDYLKY